MADNGNSVGGRTTASSGSTTSTSTCPRSSSAFSQRLHEAGMPVTPSQTAAVRALARSLTKPVSRRRLYWTTRAVFVTGFIQVPTFDRVFREVFGSRGEGATPTTTTSSSRPAPPKDDERERRRPMDDEDDRSGARGRPGRQQMNAGDGDDDDDEDTEEEEIPILLGQRGGGAVARSTSRRSTPHELAALYRLMVRLELATPVRRTRRTPARPPRRAHGHAPHAAQEPARPAATRSSSPAGAGASQKRRLVLLCDISGSMEPYARAYLQFLHCARASGPDAEAFVFATRLTRLTKQLAGRNPQRAIRRATEAVAGLVQRHAHRRRAEGVQRPLRPPRHGARLGHRDPLRRLGARRSRDGRARDAAPRRGSPTGSCGSTRASARRASRRRPAASSRRCRTATRSSAATTSRRSTRSPTRSPPSTTTTRCSRAGGPRRSTASPRRSTWGVAGHDRAARRDAQRIRRVQGQHVARIELGNMTSRRTPAGAIGTGAAPRELSYWRPLDRRPCGVARRLWKEQNCAGIGTYEGSCTWLVRTVVSICGFTRQGSAR